MCIRFIRKTAGTDKASHPSNNVAIYIENTVFLPNVSLGNNLINNSFGGRVDVHSQNHSPLLAPRWHKSGQQFTIIAVQFIKCISIFIHAAPQFYINIEHTM